MNKKQLIKMVVAASITAATAFSVYKATKWIRSRNAQEAADEVLEEEGLSTSETPENASESLTEPSTGIVEGLEEDIQAEPEELDTSKVEYNKITNKIPEGTTFPKLMEMLEEGEIGPTDEEEYLEDTDEEMEILRYEPNSKEALEQYKQMVTSSICNEQTNQTIFKLFDYDFKPMNQRDGTVAETEMNYREEFFGQDSKWVDRITMADLFLHFAKLLDFDLNGGIDKWATELLKNAELSVMIGEATFDQRVSAISHHDWYGSYGFGIFGLKPEDGDAYLATTFIEQYWGCSYLNEDFSEDNDFE